MKDPHKVAAVIERVSGSWGSPLLAALEKGPLRSGELRRRMSGRLDYRVFQDTATRLTDRGLIFRVDHEGGVSYALTADGRSVLGMLEGIERWIDTHPGTAARVSQVSRVSPAGDEDAGLDTATGRGPHSGETPRNG